MTEFKWFFVYCPWLWIWSVLFWFDFVQFSPVPTLFGAFIFTLFNQLFFYRKISRKFFKFFIIVFELILFIVMFCKRIKINIQDLLANSILFFIYLLTLRFYNTNMYQVYAYLLPAQHHKYRDTFFGYPFGNIFR